MLWSMMRNIIQVAGIADAAEAQMLLECGVRWLGFPLRLNVHREDITDAAAAGIIRSLKPPDTGVLITYLDKAAEIAGLCRFLGTRHVQVHGSINVAEVSLLKSMLPGIRVIKSLIVGSGNISELEALVWEFTPYVDGFITDTYDPATGASGATGKTHDWQVSRRLVELSNKPVILAGGLTPANVRRAILAVQPAGVDTHTGVEDRPGRKSREKVKAFVSEANKGFGSIS
jgi:phosphoribosylanthranilate isomerase